MWTRLTYFQYKKVTLYWLLFLQISYFHKNTAMVPTRRLSIRPSFWRFKKRFVTEITNLMSESRNTYRIVKFAFTWKIKVAKIISLQKHNLPLRDLQTIWNQIFIFFIFSVYNGWFELCWYFLKIWKSNIQLQVR